MELRLVELLVVLQVCYYTTTGFLQVKPDWIKTCYQKQPDFNTCNIVTLQNLFSRAAEGFPELGIPSLDPMHVAEIKILQGDNGPVALNASINNVVIKGGSKAQIISNKLDFKTYSFLTEILIPKLRIDGEYNLRGKILVLPLVGKGDAWLEPYNMRVKANHDVILREVNGRKIFDLQGITVKYTMSNLKMRLNNLYNGRKALEESTNAYINANWKLVAESIQPFIEKTVADIMFPVMKQILDNTAAEYYIGDVGED